MPDKIKRILENIKTLSPHEKAMLAHCLISSLDDANEENVDDDLPLNADEVLQSLVERKCRLQSVATLNISNTAEVRKTVISRSSALF